MTEPAPFRPSPQQRLVVLSGAGLSARTGLGTFRGPGGLWTLEPEVEHAMQASALPDSLPSLWRVWGAMARVAGGHGPTPGHYAIARMGAPVITQNVDGLHQAAGSTDVSELHGRAYTAVCLDPVCSWEAPLTPGDGERAEDHGVPSQCPLCSSPTRPDVVLFDEMLPEGALRRAQQLAVSADVFAVVGTSGTVFPAAALGPLAREHGATTVLIDIEPPSDPFVRESFDHVITGDAHQVLPDWERHWTRPGGAVNPFLDPFG
ncbi:NAD-dependent protein deacetylase [Brachybacterium endophyticum]|uniref:protein acetyllysine N-acetyltransferase n=1 Tax=Brachybacterium endophyticum TaxID=2182385 RepID=A0A2U2RM28_9MICO|nr:Sir2 family NAD-dependent protein deacetylase [Brachybacterium endophyticum]PWH06891.1 NAD-dependent protein deacetylase [Brachybacterium endophyticum]